VKPARRAEGGRRLAGKSELFWKMRKILLRKVLLVTQRHVL